VKITCIIEGANFTEHRSRCSATQYIAPPGYGGKKQLIFCFQYLVD